MIRRITVLSLIALLVAGIAMAGDKMAGEKAWFDLSCAMCSNMTKYEGLMENIDWAQYDISDGVVAVNTVNAKFLDNYRKAHEGMEATAAKMMAGEKLQLCGSCTALGMCMMKGGVHQDYVKTKTGDIWILTSDDKDMVAELQAWSAKNKEEMKKMKEMTGY